MRTRLRSRSECGDPAFSSDGAMSDPLRFGGLKSRGWTNSPRRLNIAAVKLERALAIVRFVVEEAAGPVSVFVADDHGELVAAATMDGAAPDTRLNAQRKAYTAARSDAASTRELAEKARDDPVERACFDPFFTFFLGGVGVFAAGGRKVGAVGVSGLPGEEDEALARRAIEAAETS
jgi:uncharacterized protein GlcG (DUF336 family)